MLTNDQQTKFIGRWSWGAFLLSFIWAFASRLYLYGFLMLIGMFIPLVNFIIWIVFAIIGRKLVWDSKKWTDFDGYEKRQRLLDKIGIIVIIVVVAFFAILSAYAIINFMSTRLMESN